MNSNKKIFVAPIIYILFILIPIYWLLIMSFKTNTEIAGSITLYPNQPTLDNYLFIFSDKSWYMGYINSIIYVLINVSLSLIVAIPAAYSFSRYTFFGDRGLFFGFLTFRMMAPAILLIPMVQIFSILELIDTHIAVALAHCFFNVPIAIWILEGFISSVPKEIDEMSKIDGYGFLKYFYKILLPQISPGITVTAFFCFLFSWVEILLSNALTVVYAKPIGAIMTRVASVFVANISILSAAGILTLIPGVIFVIFVKKHLARGFSMGRVV